MKYPLMRRWDGRRFGYRQVDRLIEIVHVLHFNPVVVRDNENRRSRGNTDAVALSRRRGNLPSVLSSGIHHKRHLLTMPAEKRLRKAMEIVS